MSSEPPVLSVVNDGKTVPVYPCHCGHCGNEWFMMAYSDEWMPNYCAYCGIKFIRHISGDEAFEYRPAPEGDIDGAE